MLRLFIQESNIVWLQMEQMVRVSRMVQVSFGSMAWGLLDVWKGCLVAVTQGINIYGVDELNLREVGKLFRIQSSNKKYAGNISMMILICLVLVFVVQYTKSTVKTCHFLLMLKKL